MKHGNFSEAQENNIQKTILALQKRLDGYSKVDIKLRNGYIATIMNVGIIYDLRINTKGRYAYGCKDLDTVAIHLCGYIENAYPQFRGWKI